MSMKPYISVYNFRVYGFLLTREILQNGNFSIRKNDVTTF